MTVKLELGSEFLDREDLPLSLWDLRYGFERGLVRGPTVVERAARDVERGCSDPVVAELASLSTAELARLPELLSRVGTRDAEEEASSSARKWLYLELKAAYERRDDLDDPLGFVEQAYADFDYPTSVEGFVRYMPPRPGDASGEEALMHRWASYLQSEHAALKRGG